jgi:Trypsin-like peptidase domain
MKMKKTALFIITLFFLLQACNDAKNDKTQEKTVHSKYRSLKRYPLPYPKELRNIKLPAIEVLDKERDSLLASIAVAYEESNKFKDSAIANKLAEIKVALDVNATKIMMYEDSQCGLKIDWQNVEAYDGSLGATKQFAGLISTKVGQLQWKYNFGSEFKGANDSEGKVAGETWCTGTLIGKDIFITAGHCFDNTKEKYRLPVKDGQTISTRKMAQLMKVNFNYQFAGTTNTLRPDTFDYPVLDTIEFKRGGLDYAIILLGKDKDGNLPGDKFGFTELSKDEPAQNDQVIIIQHPLGLPKVIAGGNIQFSNSFITYGTIDTDYGSSGSGIISISRKKIIGIHTSGLCTGDFNETGSNSGVSISTIVQKSPLIKKIAK